MSIPKQLLNAVAARDKLAERLRDAEIAVADLRQEAERLALDGATDEALSAAEARTREKLDRVATLRPSLAKSETIVADLERQRDEAADKKQREATSAEVEQLARAITNDCARMVAVAASLAERTAQAAPAVPESGGLQVFCQVVASQVPEASTLIARLLRQHGEQVLAGSAAASLKPPAEPYIPAPAPAKEPSVLLFCVRSTKWIDAEGKQQIAAQYTDAQIPQRLAARAFRIGCVVNLDDPVRKANHRQGGTADPAHAADLDAASGREGPPIYKSEPELVPFDRGPPTMMRVVVPRG